MYTAITLIALLASPGYDALIDDLSGDKNTASQAREVLINAGTEAFPALLSRIDDRTPIDNGLFQEERMERTSTGELILAQPRIGRVAFQIIQYQIESAWPKTLRRYYALNEQNVISWLNKHKGRSIDQLRIRAVVDSMNTVTAEIEKQGITNSRLLSLSFLRDRLGKILVDAEKRQ